MCAHFIRDEEEVRAAIFISVFNTALVPPSFLDEDLVHVADHEGDPGGAGRQRPFHRYALGESPAAASPLRRENVFFFVSSSGFMPRVFKVAPACAIMISSYEFGKATFEKMNRNRE